MSLGMPKTAGAIAGDEYCKLAMTAAQSPESLSGSLGELVLRTHTQDRGSGTEAVEQGQWLHQVNAHGKEVNKEGALQGSPQQGSAQR